MWPYGSEGEHDPWKKFDQQERRELSVERFLPPTDEEVEAERERRELEEGDGDAKPNDRS